MDKKIKIIDLHSHTYYSRCGRDNPRDLIETAIKNGVDVLGICDHNYGIADRKRQYVQEVRALAEEYQDKIRILCGIEIATYPNLYDLQSPDEIQDCDYCLLEHIAVPETIVGDLFAFCAGLKIPCGIAHNDLFAYCDSRGFAYKEFFEKMARAGIFWEMNVSFDSIHNYREHQYVKNFISDEEKIKLIKDAGVRVSVGFDSHRCEEYDGERVRKMNTFLAEKGIKTVDDTWLLAK